MKTILVKNPLGGALRINSDDFDPEKHEVFEGEQPQQQPTQYYFKEEGERVYVVNEQGEIPDGFGKGGYASQENAQKAIDDKTNQ